MVLAPDHVRGQICAAAGFQAPQPLNAPVAVFDLDGTLTKHDTLLPFLRRLRGNPYYWSRLPLAAPAAAGMVAGLLPNWRAKEILLTLFIRGLETNFVERVAHSYAREIVETSLRSRARERLEWHREQRHELVLASASPAVYVNTIAARLRFDTTLATRLVAVDGRYTGQIDGYNCWGAEKLRRLEEAVPDLSSRETYVYGDSRGDRELLTAATHRYFRTWDQP